MKSKELAIFSAMRQIVEAPGYPLLQSYKDDFYKHDLEQLHKLWHTWARAIWVVTPNGTHLSFIGQHRKQIESVEAIVNTWYRDVEIYLLSDKGVTRITRERALQLAKDLDFKVQDGCVFGRTGDKLADMRIEPCCKRNRFRVQFTSHPSLAKSAGSLAALAEIALNEVIDFNGSLFAGVSLITLDDDVIVGSTLVRVEPPPQARQYVLCRSQKVDDSTETRVLDRKNDWSANLAKAQVFDEPPRLRIEQDCFVMTKLQAAQCLAQEAYYSLVA
jgi:hypothetical protein